MRTINSIKEIEKRKRIAKETMEDYAPLAQRMGILRVRDELEDLSFKILNEEARNMIVNRIKEINPNTIKTFKEISYEIEKLLKSKIKAQVTGREKLPFQFGEKLMKNEFH